MKKVAQVLHTIFLFMKICIVQIDLQGRKNSFLKFLSRESIMNSTYGNIQNTFWSDHFGAYYDKTGCSD